MEHIISSTVICLSALDLDEGISLSKYDLTISSLHTISILSVTSILFRMYLEHIMHVTFQLRARLNYVIPNQMYPLNDSVSSIETRSNLHLNFLVFIFNNNDNADKVKWDNTIRTKTHI